MIIRTKTQEFERINVRVVSYTLPKRNFNILKKKSLILRWGFLLIDTGC